VTLTGSRVRGGTGTSNDNIQVFRSAGNTLTVAVDVGNDVDLRGGTRTGSILIEEMTIAGE